MREYIIKINKNKIESPSIALVQNDYNSTKLVFEFDVEDLYTKVFQMKLPSGSTWIKEITNNELVLADENNSEIVPVLVENGLYEFDIAIYDGNSKLTTTDKGYLTARIEIKGENVELDDRTPILDDLINRTHNAITEVGDIKAQGDYAKEQGDYAKQEAEKVDNVVDYVTTTSEEAKEISKTAESVAKGANQALSFGNYETMVSVFNALNNDTYKTGQNILIVTLNVPDLWVSGIEEEAILYTYVDDDTFVNELKTNGYVKVGYYVLSALETQKVDLTEYVKNTDYATASKGGVVTYSQKLGLNVGQTNGLISIVKATDEDIEEKTDNYKPIVPSNLDYAVGSVKASETQFGTAKMWTSLNEDGEVGLNISTEV